MIYVIYSLLGLTEKLDFFNKQLSGFTISLKKVTHVIDSSNHCTKTVS